jgi:hypothetical protein
MPIDIRSSGIRAISAALVCLTLGACVDLKNPVTQFSQAVTSTASSEDGLFAAVSQRLADVQNLCMLSAQSVDINASGQLTPVGFTCPTTAPSNMQQAADAVAQALKTYAASLQAAVNDTPAATFSTNVDTAGKSLLNFDQTVLQPFAGLKGGPTQTEVNAVGAAVKDIGGALVTFAQTRVVQDAARKMQDPLHQIATHLGNINTRWAAANLAKDLTGELGNFVIVLWRKGTITDRQTLLTMFNKDAAPAPSADAVNKALLALATANDKIATAGPTLSLAEIQSALQAADDAAAAINAIKTGK